MQQIHWRCSCTRVVTFCTPYTIQVLVQFRALYQRPRAILICALKKKHALHYSIFKNSCVPHPSLWLDRMCNISTQQTCLQLAPSSVVEQFANCQNAYASNSKCLLQFANFTALIQANVCRVYSSLSICAILGC